jgi:hypothetical protein
MPAEHVPVEPGVDHDERVRRLRCAGAAAWEPNLQAAGIGVDEFAIVGADDGAGDRLICTPTSATAIPRHTTPNAMPIPNPLPDSVYAAGPPGVKKRGIRH